MMLPDSICNYKMTSGRSPGKDAYDKLSGVARRESVKVVMGP
jgi:hypothetical protein